MIDEGVTLQSKGRKDERYKDALISHKKKRLFTIYTPAIIHMKDNWTTRNMSL